MAEHHTALDYMVVEAEGLLEVERLLGIEELVEAGAGAVVEVSPAEQMAEPEPFLAAADPAVAELQAVLVVAVAQPAETVVAALAAEVQLHPHNYQSTDYHPTSEVLFDPLMGRGTNQQLGLP